MALRFTRRNPETLFYPTVHVHDGDVPEQARFDHTLYAQWHDGYDEAFAARSSDEVTFAADVWTRSTDNLGKFVSARKAPEITDPSRRAYQLHLSGMLDNVDTVVHTHGYKPAAL